MKHKHPAQDEGMIQTSSAGELCDPNSRHVARIVDVPSVFDFAETGIEWGVTGLIAVSAVTMIVGDAGLLKLTLLTAAGRAVSDGADFAGIPTTRREVLILDRGGIISKRGAGTVSAAGHHRRRRSASLRELVGRRCHARVTDSHRVCAGNYS